MSILPQPALCVPSTAEIIHVAASAKHRHPTLVGRIDKARDILLYSQMELDALSWEKCQLARWKVASQSNNGAYVVNGTSCPCRDHAAEYCKHAISVALYQKILCNRLNADIQARAIDLGICVDGTFNAYAKRMGFVHVRKMGSAYIFADMASAVRYSMWAAQQPILAAWPVAAMAVAA